MTTQQTAFHRRAIVTKYAEQVTTSLVEHPQRTDDALGKDLSLFGRTLWRYAEGTLGDYPSPFWENVVLPKLAEFDEIDRRLVALAISAEMLGGVFEKLLADSVAPAVAA